MSDEMSTAALLASAGYTLGQIGVKDLIVAVAKPTMDHFGEVFRNLILPNYKINLEKIIYTAEKKVKDRGIPEDNSVQAGVISEIFRDAAFQQGEMYAEYYGGVLASSQLFNKNDIGKSICQIITKLSAYDLRFHFILYSCLKGKFKNKTINLGDNGDCGVCRVFISKESFIRSMGFTDEESEYKDIIFSTCLHSLSREDLIYPEYSYAEKGFMKSRFGVEGSGFILGPTETGAALLMWAQGYGLTRPSQIFSDDIEISKFEDISIPECIHLDTTPKSGLAGDVIRLKNLDNHLRA